MSMPPMPAPSDLIDLGPLADLPNPGSRGFTVADCAGLLIRHGDLLRAYRDRCPHIGGPLAWLPDGRPNRHLDADEIPIECTLHGARFLIDDGTCVHGPCLGAALKPLPVKVADGRVWLDPTALDEDDD